MAPNRIGGFAGLLSSCSAVACREWGAVWSLPLAWHTEIINKLQRFISDTEFLPCYFSLSGFIPALVGFV